MLATTNTPLDLGNLEGMSAAEIAQKIENEALKLPQLQIETTHLFAHNLYAREIKIPAGALLTGHTHRLSQLNIVSKGDISVLTDQGVKRLTAPATFVSPPGTKRVGYAHAETVWTTVLGVEEKDIEEIEKKYIVRGEEEFKKYCLEHPDIAKLAGD